MENNTNIFSKRIKELRESLNMSQADFAKSVNTSQTTLSSYENTDKTPSLDIVKEIALQYNVSLDWLFGLNEYSTTHQYFKTYSDILLTFNELFKLPELEATFDITYESETPEIIYQVVSLQFDDEQLVKLVSEWKDVLNLCQKSASGKKLYEIWLKDTAERLNIPISKNPSPRQPDNNPSFF